MYADDTIIYFAARNIRTVQQALQGDATTLAQWFSANKLSLNPTKCKTMLVRSPRTNCPNTDLQLTLAGTKLEQVHTFKYLGVVIDSMLNWHDHCEHIHKKLAQIIGIIKCLKPYLSTQALLTLYTTLFLPHVQYCSTVWDQGGKGDLEKIQKLQTRAGRVILGCDRYTPTSNVLHTLRWVPVVDIHKRSKAILVFKALNGLTTPHLTALFTQFSEIHAHNTRLRSQGGLQLPKAKSEHRKKALSFSGAALWNSFSSRLKSAGTLTLFKKIYSQEYMDTGH
ncbi:hypothetical protein Bbelb_276660 [Branchiostoma belcheri]|nr:hypothetical protein Bbelb_276660 [Branchiostoma belcheri]